MRFLKNVFVWLWSLWYSHLSTGHHLDSFFTVVGVCLWFWLWIVDYCDRQEYVSKVSLHVNSRCRVKIGRRQYYRCKHQTELIGNWQVWTGCFYISHTTCPKAHIAVYSYVTLHQFYPYLHSWLSFNTSVFCCYWYFLKSMCIIEFIKEELKVLLLEFKYSSCSALHIVKSLCYSAIVFVL